MAQAALKVDQVPANAGNLKKSPIIYGLTDKSGEVFYVGKTSNPGLRLRHHRYRFGNAILMTTLQDVFGNELPAEAEKKWIRYFWKIKGHRLKNVTYTKIDSDLVCLGFRNASMRRWQMVVAISKQRNIRLGQALNEMMDDWAEKNSSPSAKNSAPKKGNPQR